MPSSGAIPFQRFVTRSNMFFTLIGIQPIQLIEGLRRSYLLDVLFGINFINMNLVLFGEIMYVVMAIKNGTNFLEATMNLAYIGFVVKSDIKIISILRQKDRLKELLRSISAIYPQRAQLQRDYKVRNVLTSYKRTTFIFAVTNMCCIWAFNLYNWISYFFYDFLFDARKVELSLPYYCWTPWQWQDHWSYYPLYSSLTLAGHTSMCGSLACDIVLCAVVGQLIMHFQYVAKAVEDYVGHAKFKENDMKFLQSIVEYHDKILCLSEIMNDVFGLNLLLNFMSSTFILCFISFQATIGAETDFLVMLLLFLFCSFFQVYMISNYGEELIIASESVGVAVYRHDWQNADKKYRKMLTLIIHRSQKPTMLKATNYLHISLGTVTDIIQVSYKFFALVRTLYSK